MTELVTIEHDRQAIYTFGTPYARKTLLPHVKRTERFEYLIGETKPNFPLPVPASVAISYRFADRGLFNAAIPD